MRLIPHQSITRHAQTKAAERAVHCSIDHDIQRWRQQWWQYLADHCSELRHARRLVILQTSSPSATYISRPSWCPTRVLELNVEPLSVQNITAHYTKIHRSYRQILDRWTPFVLQRWLATAGLLSVFLLRIILAQGVSLPSILAFQKNDSNSH